MYEASPKRPAAPDVWHELDDPSVAQRPQRRGGSPGIDAEMFGDEARRTRRDQTTVAPLGIEDEVLEHDPRLRAEDAQQIAGVRPDDHAALDAHGVRRPSHQWSYDSWGRSGTVSARRINQFVGIRFW